jgi:hypothetical protein
MPIRMPMTIIPVINPSNIPGPTPIYLSSGAAKR